MEVTCETTPTIRLVGSHAIQHTIGIGSNLPVSLLPLFVDNIQVGIILQIKDIAGSMMAELGINNLTRKDF